MKKFSKVQLAEMLACAMNILNAIHHEVNEEGKDILDGALLGEFHGLANAMPEACDYWKNGTVMAKDLL